MKDGLRRDIDKNSLAIVDDRKRHDSEISETKARCRVIESRLGAVESGQTAMVRTLENVRDSLHRIEINITRFCPHREFDHNSLQRRGGAIIPNIRPGDLRVPASVPRG